MKKCFLLFFFSLTLILNAQENNNSLVYSEVVEVKDVIANDLYLRAKTWFATTFVNSQKVIQMDDQQSNTIIGKAKIKYSSTIFVGSLLTTGYVDFTLKISCKDGRYKYEFFDFIHNGTTQKGGTAKNFGLLTFSDEYPYKENSPKKWANKVWMDIKKQVDDETKIIIQSLKKSMQIKTNNTDNSW